jgi:hypothetical protein|tara:strand:- start:233 stop:1096 length:864 start_codon:yes stop_codon:yes gene_type:complete
MNLKEQILVSLGLNKSIKLAWQEKAEDGTIFVSEADTLTAGADISVLTEDGTTILLPVGTYRTESGLAFRVDEDGVVAEVLETSLEDTEEVVEEETFAEIGDWEGMEKRIQNLEDAVASLKGEDVAMEDEEEKKEEELEDEAVEVAVEEAVVEVVEVVEEAVAEIATAIDEATPAEVTPDLAAKAAEIAIEIIQEKAEEVAEEVTLSRRSKSKRKFSNSKRVLSKAKASKVARLNKKIKSLKSKLSRKPANNPLNVNKFSSNRSHTVSAKDYGQMTRREKFLHDLNK